MTKRAAIDVQVAASASASADDFLRLSLQQASMSATNKEISKPSRTRTSSFRGVTKHRWSSKYEAHLWDNSWVNESGRKGKQVYLGGYDTEEKAAIAYDLAALKYWGRSPTLFINFPERDYTKELKEMETMSRREYIAHLKRNSSGFSRGVSKYRGVTRHHCDGRWQARIGKEKGSKDVYLGTFSSQEEAAEAYDIASIKLKGVNVVTNFDISCYDVEKILKAKLPFQEPKQTKKQQVVESAGLDSSYATPYGFLMQDLVQGQAVAHAGGYPQVMLQPQVQAPSQSRVYGYPQSILAFGYPYPVFFYPTATAADSASH